MVCEPAFVTRPGPVSGARHHLDARASNPVEPTGEIVDRRVGLASPPCSDRVEMQADLMTIIDQLSESVEEPGFLAIGVVMEDEIGRSRPRGPLQSRHVERYTEIVVDVVAKSDSVSGVLLELAERQCRSKVLEQSAIPGCDHDSTPPATTRRNIANRVLSSCSQFSVFEAFSQASTAAS